MIFVAEVKPSPKLSTALILEEYKSKNFYHLKTQATELGQRLEFVLITRLIQLLLDLPEPFLELFGLLRPDHQPKRTAFVLESNSTGR